MAPAAQPTPSVICLSAFCLIIMKKVIYLEEGDIRHDGSDNSNNLGIVIEQVSPVLLERHTDNTGHQLQTSQH